MSESKRRLEAQMEREEAQCEECGTDDAGLRRCSRCGSEFRYCKDCAEYLGRTVCGYCTHMTSKDD